MLLAPHQTSRQVRDGQLPPTAARRAAAFIIACGSVLAAGFAWHPDPQLIGASLITS